jgi:hypothetical protein
MHQTHLNVLYTSITANLVIVAVLISQYNVVLFGYIEIHSIELEDVFIYLHYIYNNFVSQTFLQCQSSLMAALYYSPFS